MNKSTFFSGFKIKGLRLKYSLSSAFVAEKLDITTTYLSLIESGKKKPSNKIIKKASILFDVSLEDFEEPLELLHDIHELENKIDIANLIAVLEMITKKNSPNK